MVFRKEEFLAATKDWAVPQKFAPIWAKFAVRNSFVLRWNDATGRYQFLFALAINVLPCPTHRLTHFWFVFWTIFTHSASSIQQNIGFRISSSTNGGVYVSTLRFCDVSFQERWGKPAPSSRRALPAKNTSCDIYLLSVRIKFNQRWNYHCEFGMGGRREMAKARLDEEPDEGDVFLCKPRHAASRNAGCSRVVLRV